MLLQSNNLASPKQDKLRRLLDSDGFDVLVEVLESKAFAHEVDAANSAVESTAGYDSQAKEAARKAVSIRDGIGLLKSMREQQSNFQISTAKPTPTTQPK